MGTGHQHKEVRQHGLEASGHLRHRHESESSEPFLHATQSLISAQTILTGKMDLASSTTLSRYLLFVHCMKIYC